MTGTRSTSGMEENRANEKSLNLEERLTGDLDALSEFAEELAHGERSGRGALGNADASGSQRINADPERVEEGLAKLVLALIDLVRQLLEKQAIRRVEAGSLTDDEIERMGETFLKLDRKMSELKATFGLEEEDLSLSLGPVRDLLAE